MEALTVDVGTGTQDVLLYDSSKNIRNCLKMILPSPTKVVAERIRVCTESGKNIMLTGYTMGGGPCTRYARKHIERGLRIFAFPKPALTFNDDLQKVREMGVEIVESEMEDAERIEMRDAFMPEFEAFFKNLSVSIPDKIFFSVQDHGFSPDMSNRKFRFMVFERTARKGSIYSFFYRDVPEYFNRMRSVVESIEDYGRSVGREFEVFIIDTVFSAVIGAMVDCKEFPALIVNFGNSHTIGAVVDEDGTIYSLFEHHTFAMKQKGLEGINRFIERFVRGEISNEDVFNEGGHGAYVDEVVDVKDRVCTGPNSHLCKYRTANPAGDTMITGNIGMLKAYCELTGEELVI
ncbi:Uncharacterized protein conserved in archaea [Archaeoglobus sulfaticallidus PM70-1]|uniref:Uncharacterized protein conserved in archaea n=1 Tax=Archaeoglobus sulfaticallidus PM70-1 TaxID=387631 RepID=N0BGF5_9EURY|nr:DUF1786 domain-containing protein [Archaeoglobus sulfaticallidus]AGK62073.1 Uncharacterized protein conserved in archaea [Archaeoglobus sulfaticallidus PM70-1]